MTKGAASRTVRAGGIEGGPALGDLVARIEEEIVLGRLLPRQRLVEDDLIERFGASRHTVRQALMQLDALGLVVRVPNRGAEVASLAADDIGHLHALRSMLEAEAARLIPLPMVPEDLHILEAIQARHDAAVEADDLVEIFRSNHAFHRHLFACCGNRFLVEAIEAAALKAHGVRFLPMRSVENRRVARDQHHEMLAAIRRSDREALVQLCRNHVARLKDGYANIVHVVETPKDTREDS
ncbi:GntR family transcriptional regulator [Xanthobacter versatilis]|uniref:GntR family transcriptional regulator n=1 Tax=Xanthobacter autotrophicus (strain ATCC BAA-1158 / Py2) TaxID=78245 RepID=UPI00372ACF8B